MAVGLGIGVGLPFGGLVGEPSFFDKYGTPDAGFSVVKLGSNNTLFEVRRSSDNAVADFTYSEVTDGTLVAWVGGGNDGFVRTWYGQGGINAVQTSASNQPRIVLSGTLRTENGIPAIAFSTDKYLDVSLASYNDLVTGTNFASFFVHSESDYTTPRGTLYNIGNGTNAIGITSRSQQFRGGFFNGTSYTIQQGRAVLINAQKYLTTFTISSGTGELTNFPLTTNSDGNSPTLSPNANLRIGANNGAGQPLTGNVQCALFYSVDKSSVVSDMNTELISLLNIS